MKKIFVMFFIYLLTLCLCSCSSEKSTNSPDLETQYYNYEQQCIDEGKTEQAVKILKEGIDNTQSEKLKELLNSLTDKAVATTTTTLPIESSTTTAQIAVENNFRKYVGKWHCPDLSQGNSGWIIQLLMDIAIKDDKLAILVKYSCDVPEYPEYYEIAEIKKVVSVSEIKDNMLSIQYDDDGYGNSGTLEFTFLNDQIFCVSNVNEHTDIYGEYYNGWSFNFGTCKLVKEESAEDLFG